MTPDKFIEVTTHFALINGDKILKRHFGCGASIAKKSKSASDVVTEADRQLEMSFQKVIRQADPTIGFRGEEFGHVPGKDNPHEVNCDPVDGTGNFMRGIDACVFQAALTKDNDILAAVVYDFCRKHMYTAIKGAGAHCNNQPLHVSTATELNNAYLFGSFNPHHNELECVLTEAGSHIARLGCAGYEMLLVASGKAEGKVRDLFSGSLWDFAPGALLITESGGKITNIRSDEYNYNHPCFVAATPAIHDRVKKLELC